MQERIDARIAELEARADELEAQPGVSNATYRGGVGSPSVDREGDELAQLQQEIGSLRTIGSDLLRLRARQYDLGQALNGLRLRCDNPETLEAQKESYAVQRAIVDLSNRANELIERTILAPQSTGRVTRGAATTGLIAEINIQMEQVPLAYCHLLKAGTHPLLCCTVRNTGNSTRRIRVVTYIEGYTAQDIVSREIPGNSSAGTSHLPTFFPDRIRSVRELTRATLTVLVEDLDSKKVEIHQTQPIWLLARNSAPLAVRNPDTNDWTDLSRYFGAFVTPHREEVEAFLTDAVGLHCDGELSGYQAGEVTSQVRAVYEALQETRVRYVDSTIDFAPDQGASTQRVRLPRETLKRSQANCIDGTLLMASLLEAIGINPAIVIVPGHAFLGWSTVRPEGLPGDENMVDDEWAIARWDYLETTCLGSADGAIEFDAARMAGTTRANAALTEQRKADKDPERPGEHWFRRWSLRELRAKYGITPME